ncbi:MAG: hypothetical protein DDT29_00736 [Dehalococcoidia bacterium]|nr:hypothetical protein [Bacillota bacterium]
MALTVVMVMSAFAVPAAAGQENGRKRRNVSTTEIQHLDAEVQVIAGQPVITVETKRGYVDIPFALSDVFLVDGQTIPFQLQGDGVVVPTEDGSVVVPLKEFEVVVANGQAMLVAEVNPLPVIVITGAKIFGGAVLVGAGTHLGARIIDAIWPPRR